MKTNNRRVPAKFGPKVRSESGAAASVEPGREEAARFERLKNRLLEQQLEEAFDLALGAQLRRAANEAAALAWVTAFPLLLFPVLFEEQARAAMVRANRQSDVLQRSRSLLVMAESG